MVSHRTCDDVDVVTTFSAPRHVVSYMRWSPSFMFLGTTYFKEQHYCSTAQLKKKKTPKQRRTGKSIQLIQLVVHTCRPGCVEGFLYCNIANIDHKMPSICFFIQLEQRTVSEHTHYTGRRDRRSHENQGGQRQLSECYAWSNHYNHIELSMYLSEVF